MAQLLIGQILVLGRTIIADRKRRLRGCEAVTADGDECDPCDDTAQRFCAVGALIRAAWEVTGDPERAHSLGWQLAGKIAVAARLRRLDEHEPGWNLAMLSDTRGQDAVLRAVDALIENRRG